MIRFLVDHVGPVLVAVSLAAAAISTAKWLLDLRAERQTRSHDVTALLGEDLHDPAAAGVPTYWSVALGRWVTIPEDDDPDPDEVS